MAGLSFAVTADNRNFIQAMRDVEKSVKNTADKIEKSGGKAQVLSLLAMVS